MQKSKSMTIAMVVMGVLLAAAIAATITLAAFSASRKATTTITFTNGIVLNVTGITQIGETGTYAWNATVDGTANNTGTATNAAAFTMSAITIQNDSSSGTPAYLVAVASIVGKKTSLDDDNVDVAGITAPTADAAGWVLKGGYYYYAAAGSTEENLTLAPVAKGATVNFVSATTQVADNDLAGYTYTSSFKVFAVDTINGTITDLTTGIAAL